MHILLSIVIQTANVLGIFSDPFEFAGDYGSMNTTRQKVFEKVAVTETMTDTRLSIIATPELLAELETLELPKQDVINIQNFIKKYGEENMFAFLRNAPSAFLSMDITLKRKAAKEGTIFNLPILNSPELLKGENVEELKKELLRKVMTADHLKFAKAEEDIEKSLDEINLSLFKQSIDIQDLKIFCTPTGQAFLYWLYHSMNLQLACAENPAMIEEINQVKTQFIQTLGNPEARASQFREKLIQANASVVFTQESDTFTSNALALDGKFHPVDMQNSQDGCFVFLRSDYWEPDYKMVPISDYEGFESGKLNVILARTKEGENFLLASCHGHSTKAEDGRRQICKVMEQYYKLQKEYSDLQLVIGIDANTKTEEDIKKFRELLDSLGLYGTSVGPTTIKQRMITVQHAKAKHICIDEEDYLITLKPENGGHYLITRQTVGFSNRLPKKDRMLPDQDNPSDHYSVGATLEKASKVDVIADHVP